MFILHICPYHILLFTIKPNPNYSKDAAFLSFVSASHLHLHLRPSSSLIFISNLRALSSPSPTQTLRSLLSDDAYHGEASLTRALSLSSSSISGSLHLSCLSLFLKSSGMVFDGLCSLSQSIVVFSFVHVWVREFLLHKAHVFVGFCYSDV